MKMPDRPITLKEAIEARVRDDGQYAIAYAQLEVARALHRVGQELNQIATAIAKKMADPPMAPDT